MTMRSGLIAALVGLVGCQSGGAVTSQQTPGAMTDDCGAAALQRYVGQPLTAYDFAAAHDPLRVIPHGTAVTTDYVPHRLNVELDRAGLITRIFCG